MGTIKEELQDKGYKHIMPLGKNVSYIDLGDISQIKNNNTKAVYPVGLYTANAEESTQMYYKAEGNTMRYLTNVSIIGNGLYAVAQNDASMKFEYANLKESETLLAQYGISVDKKMICSYLTASEKKDSFDGKGERM